MGPYFWEQQWEIFQCPDLEVNFVAGLVATYPQAQHKNERTPQWTSPIITTDPRIYRVSFPRADRFIRCLVGNCEERATTHTNL